MTFDVSSVITIVVAIGVIAAVLMDVASRVDGDDRPAAAASGSAPDAPQRSSSNSSASAASEAADDEWLVDERETADARAAVRGSARVTRVRLRRRGSDALLSVQALAAALAAPHSRVGAQLVALWRREAERRGAFFFECAPTRPSRAALTPFECVFLSAPRLARVREDRLPFAAHFAAAAPGAAAVAFASLGGDATLVAPTPRADTDAAHAAAFALTAPLDAQLALLAATGRALQRALERHAAAGRDAPLWLSTSGLGVSYLHVRLDSRPKYYHFDEFRQVPDE